MQTGILHQNLVPHFLYGHRIRLHRLTARQWGFLTEHLSDDATTPICGVSVRLSKEHGRLDGVAFATPTDVFYANIAYADEKLWHGKSNLARVLDGSLCVLVGFGMPRIALHLHRQCGLHVEGVELSTLFTVAKKKFQTAADFASRRIHPDVNRSRIHAAWYGDDDEDVCLRAWLSAVLATESFKEVQRAAKVDTRNLPDSHLSCLSRLLLNVELLEGGRPTEMENEFDGVDINSDADEWQLVIHNSRFKTRVRKSAQTSVIIEVTDGPLIVGHAVHAEGKQTGVKITGGNIRGSIERIHVVGREELTIAETARDEFILLLLQGALPPLVDSPFIRMLWFPTEKASPWGHRPVSSIPPLGPQFSQLNQSQNQVVAAMLAQDEPLVVVHGPPGTGKTTTIAAALQSWARECSPVWVIAQSNVGVRDIADTLLKYGIDSKLLVSKEYYVEWHEHFYEKLKGRFVCSDELFADTADVERILGSSRVILCTISMLSNPAMDNCGMFHLIPVKRLVVDEASQIDTLDFMHLFHKFRKLEKVCMFGDPKQLPPYGKEDAPQMKTIYDFKHLKASAHFLKTQYRMPVPLGEFISEYVYDKKLLSVHPVTDFSAVRFVDVWYGQEERVGTSWKNTEEARTVVKIVKNYYKTKDFCVITPYDAQRVEIAKQLKAEGLQGDNVFNVDSFQGREAQYVVISTVRTTAPGFLRSCNRANVMLTRCKHGMVIVSKRDFLTGQGRATLLGELAQWWYRGARRPEEVWIHPFDLVFGRASLPGVPGRSVVVPAPSPSPVRSTRRTVVRTPAASRPRPSLWEAVIQPALLKLAATTATRSAEPTGPLRNGRVTPNDPPNLPPSSSMPTRTIRPSYAIGFSPGTGPALMLPSVGDRPGQTNFLTASEPAQLTVTASEPAQLAVAASKPAQLAATVETPSLCAERPDIPEPKDDTENESPWIVYTRRRNRNRKLL